MFEFFCFKVIFAKVLVKCISLKEKVLVTEELSILLIISGDMFLYIISYVTVKTQSKDRVDDTQSKKTTSDPSELVDEGTLGMASINKCVFV